MKHADKNEVDILLRSLAKHARLAAALDKPASSVDVNHLDADELSSYAEDALPSATRARYTSHIADCASCRKLVTSLTLSAGVPVREEVALEPAKSFWQKLAPFFSPAVLKYATPALALGVVIIVGLVVLRQSRNSELVVQTSRVEETGRQQNIEEKFGSPAPTEVAQAKRSDGSEANGVVNIPKEEPAKANEAGAAAQEKDQSTKTADSNPAAAQPSYAPEPTVTSAPPPAKPVQEKQREVVADGADRTEAERETKDRDELAKNDSRVGGITARKLENLPASRPAAGRGQSGPSDKKKAATESKVAKEEETRSVAGRRFRREGNSWVDTGYNQAAGVVRVSRGSEQFRALVADEPGIKTVSEELPGVVIVVWKGRAYRIQ